MRPCPRTIDRPLHILGLEGEDIAVLLLCGVPAILFSPTVPVLGLFVGWPLVAALKKGRPEGVVIHLLYKWGVPFKGLLPPGEEIRYAVYGKNENG